MKRRCPICKSEDLNYMPWLGQIYKCRKCGYVGPLIITKKSKK